MDTNCFKEKIILVTIYRDKVILYYQNVVDTKKIENKNT
jgi:hypothetical protein